jgi:hypothetical protein
MHALAYVYDGAVVDDAAARLHLPYLQSTVRPLLALCYDPDPDSDAHIQRLRVLTDMQAMAAKDPEQWVVAQSTLEACYRNSYAVGAERDALSAEILEREGPWVPFIPLDGAPEPSVAAAAFARLPKRWVGGAPELPLDQIVHLASLVDTQKKVRGG